MANRKKKDVNANISVDEMQKNEQTVAEELKAEEAKAVLEEQTVSAAESVSLDADPVGEPVVTEAAEQAEEALVDRVRIISPTKLVVKRFFRSRLSVAGFCIFIAVLVFSFLGPVFVPWGEGETDISDSYNITYNNVPYTYVDESGEQHTYYSISYGNIKGLNAHAPAFTYGYRNGEKALHVLGTDKDGYDIFVRLMYGGRLSLMLAFLVVIVYTVIGVILGGLAGYFGGWVDMVIMRIIDILNCIPSLPILLIVGAIYEGMHGPESMRIYFMLGALTLLSWPGTARLVRGQILFLREQEYMVAADALGFSSARKIFKHLIPNVMPQLIVSMTLGLGGTILTESSLSFLGLGVPTTAASLGQMVTIATTDYTVLEFFPMDWLPAGIMIILAVVAFNFIGDGLRDALDPKMKR